MSLIVIQVPILVVLEGRDEKWIEGYLNREELRRKVEAELRNEVSPIINIEPFYKPPIRFRTVLGIKDVRDWLKEKQNDEHKTGS